LHGKERSVLRSESLRQRILRHNEIKISLRFPNAHGEHPIKTGFTNFTYLSFVPITNTRANFEIFDSITVTIYVTHVKIDPVLSLWCDSKQNSISRAA